MTYLEYDRFLRDISKNLKKARGYMEEGSMGLAQGQLEGTIQAIKDVRDKNLKKRRDIDKALDQFDYRRSHR